MPRGRSSNLFLQLPPRHTCFGAKNSGEHLSQSHGYSETSSSAGSGDLGFLRGLSFKNKAILRDGEGTSLLNPESAAKPGKITCQENAVFANIVARFSWKRCASLPIKRTSDMSPSPTSAQEKTNKDQHVSQVGFLTYESLTGLVYHNDFLTFMA